jgi:hypothetical protein
VQVNVACSLDEVVAAARSALGTDGGTSSARVVVDP